MPIAKVTSGVETLHSPAAKILRSLLPTVVASPRNFAGKQFDE